jgi:hypothetical protein
MCRGVKASGGSNPSLSAKFRKGSTMHNLEAQSYQLVVRIPFKALDDPQARQIAKEDYLRDMGIPVDASVKLQRIFPDKAPQSVQLNGEV